MAVKKKPVALLTVKRIAELLNVSTHKVNRVIKLHSDVQPIATADKCKIYDGRALLKIKHYLRNPICDP